MAQTSSDDVTLGWGIKGSGAPAHYFRIGTSPVAGHDILQTLCGSSCSAPGLVKPRERERQCKRCERILARAASSKTESI